jgi:hypothetical protein
MDRLRWVMETSLLKTLAAKHRSSVAKMAARHKAVIETPHGPRTCFEAVRIREANQKPLVARFGGIPLKRQKNAILTDRAPGRENYPRKEIITRLLRNTCELCQHNGQVQVHHVARLADLARPGHGQPAWARLMAKRRRKTLVVCPSCHDQIHAERPPAKATA